MANARYVSALFNSRNQAHVFHLRTKSYAQHMALQAYYEGIIPLVDSYVEAYQGTRNRRLNGLRKNSVYIQDPTKALAYFVRLKKRIRSMKPLASETHLKNIRDEIMQLLSSTIYKLRFLK